MALHPGRLPVLCLVFSTVIQTGVNSQTKHNLAYKDDLRGQTEEREEVQPFDFSLPFSTLVRRMEKREPENTEELSPPTVVCRQFPCSLDALLYLQDVEGVSRLIPWTRPGGHMARDGASMEEVSGSNFAKVERSGLYFPIKLKNQNKVKRGIQYQYPNFPFSTIVRRGRNEDGH